MDDALACAAHHGDWPPGMLSRIRAMPARDAAAVLRRAAAALAWRGIYEQERTAYRLAADALEATCRPRPAEQLSLFGEGPPRVPAG